MQQTGKPRIAVVLTNYNDSRFLINAIEKIKLQGPDEIVFADDYSTDNSFEIVSKLFPEVTAVRNRSEKGAFNAYMTGVNATSCEYICPVAADDEFLAGHIAAMRDAIEKYPIADLYTCNELVLREGEMYSRILFPFDAYISPEYAAKIFKNGYGKNINFAGIVVSKKLIDYAWVSGGHSIKSNFDDMYNFYAIFSRGFVNLGKCLYLFRSFPNGFGATRKREEIAFATDVIEKFLTKALKPLNYVSFLESGVLSKKSFLKTQIALWAINHMPKFAREIFYRWFYRYDWRIEKL